MVCDESLHHADFPLKLLDEVSKVLSDDGLAIFTREPIAPQLPFLTHYVKSKFGSHEKQYGVTEKIYTIKEWKDLFLKAGYEMAYFSLDFPFRTPIIDKIYNIHSIFPYLHKIIYGVKSMPVVFICKKLNHNN